MEIIKLNNAEFDRVLKAKDANNILELDEYLKLKKKQNDQLIAETEKKIEVLKKKVYEEISAEIRSKNEEQLDELYTNLEQVLKTIDEKLFDIIYQILTKLGYLQVNSLQIRNLIQEEIGNLIGQKQVKILINERMAEKIKSEFNEPVSKQLTWAIKNELSDEECICETNMWTLRIDLATLKKQINRILAHGGTSNG